MNLSAYLELPAATIFDNTLRVHACNDVIEPTDYLAMCRHTGVHGS